MRVLLGFTLCMLEKLVRKHKTLLVNITFLFKRQSTRIELCSNHEQFFLIFYFIF
jgi:hypothetical protein